MVNGSALVQHALVGGTACKWTRLLQDVGLLRSRAANIFALPDLLLAASSTKHLASLHRQLVWQVARQFERSAFVSAKRRNVHEDLLERQADPFAHISRSPGLLSDYLTRYVVSTLRASEGVRCISIATDAGNVPPKKYQFTVGVLPGNVGFTFAPQVAHGGFENHL